MEPSATQMNQATDDLGTLGGREAYAQRISNNGRISGFARIADAAGSFRAYQYFGGVMRDLGTLGGASSFGYDITDAGQQVGEALNGAGAARAFIYTGGRLYDLNTLIPANSGWVLSSARGINQAGQIVGIGTFGGRTRAFLLTFDTTAKQEQTITFAQPADRTFGAAPFQLLASASSGLPVTFEVVSGPATIEGHLLTMTGSGNVTVRARQNGDAAFNAAPPVERTFTVAKATPVINWAEPDPIIVGTPIGATQLNAAAYFQGSPLAGSFTYNPPSVALLPIGDHQLRAEFSPSDSANFTAASKTITQRVNYRVCALYDELRVHQIGSVVPIRLQLCDVAGRNLSSGAIALRAIELVRLTTNAVGEVEDAGQANPDLNFRLDGGAYVFNLQTRGLQTGLYQLNFTAGADPYRYSVRFQLR
jgi:probable HAF family extracellular repeat protein